MKKNKGFKITIIVLLGVIFVLANGWYDSSRRVERREEYLNKSIYYAFTNLGQKVEKISEISDDKKKAEVYSETIGTDVILFSLLDRISFYEDEKYRDITKLAQFFFICNLNDQMDDIRLVVKPLKELDDYINMYYQGSDEMKVFMGDLLDEGSELHLKYNEVLKIIDPILKKNEEEAMKDNEN